MVETRIEIPEQLYETAARVARKEGVTISELVRRGLEALVRTNLASQLADVPWRPPEPRTLGSRDLTHEELKEQAQLTTVEEELMASARKDDIPRQ